MVHDCPYAGDLTRDELGETLRALLSAVSALSLNPRDADVTSKFCVEYASAVFAEAGPSPTALVET